jgi:hypothetical protein
MVEHQLKGLCYNCDEKYFQGINVRNKNYLWPYLRTFLMMKLMEGLRRTFTPH